ncbi:MAG TPA: redox-regulated ATPase YchF [Candidatus Baltobacteraceae bacterium]|nr:redox-regulated ATPase YchF [Candidatus Baltobacteraceae bacterium]
MRIGIIGLPATGKTTLFNLLCESGGSHIGHQNAKEPNVAVVKVPDPRLDFLAELFQPKKLTPATIEFIDFVALTRGAGKGEGLGSHFLTQMRQVDALVHVLRDFDNPGVAHVETTVDPVRDAGLVNTELFLADLDTVEKRIARLELDLKKIKKDESIRELDLLRRCHEWLVGERPIRDLDLSLDEAKLLRGFTLLTAKPMLFLLNLGEENLGQANPAAEAVRALGGKNVGLCELCLKVEWEVSQLPPDDAAAFRADLGLAAEGFDRVLRACFDLLGLITFYTGEGGEETRAWTIPAGSSALKAAGVIHSDLERGFIRAEVVHYADLKALGSMAAVRKKGLHRVEGKEYVMADGDIVIVRFNV